MLLLRPPLLPLTANTSRVHTDIALTLFQYLLTNPHSKSTVGSFRFCLWKMNKEWQRYPWLTTESNMILWDEDPSTVLCSFWGVKNSWPSSIIPELNPLPLLFHLVLSLSKTPLPPNLSYWAQPIFDPYCPLSQQYFAIVMPPCYISI